MNQELISVISAFFGSLGFSIIYNIRGLRIWIPAIGGAVFWAVYLIFLHFINNEFLGFFFVAILITIYSEIWARILKTPSTVILMPTVIPLIPGGSLYYAMDAALRHDMPQFFLKAQAAVGLAVALAAGIMAVTSMQHLISALIKMIKPSKKLSYLFKNSSTMATNTAEPSQSTSSSTSNFGLWWETSVPFAGLEELKNMNAPGSFSR